MLTSAIVANQHDTKNRFDEHGINSWFSELGPVNDTEYVTSILDLSSWIKYSVDMLYH